MSGPIRSSAFRNVTGAHGFALKSQTKEQQQLRDIRRNKSNNQLNVITLTESKQAFLCLDMNLAKQLIKTLKFDTTKQHDIASNNLIQLHQELSIFDKNLSQLLDRLEATPNKEAPEYRTANNNLKSAQLFMTAILDTHGLPYKHELFSNNAGMDTSKSHRDMLLNHISIPNESIATTHVLLKDYIKQNPETAKTERAETDSKVEPMQPQAVTKSLQPKVQFKTRIQDVSFTNLSFQKRNEALINYQIQRFIAKLNLPNQSNQASSASSYFQTEAHKSEKLNNSENNFSLPRHNSIISESQSKLKAAEQNNSFKKTPKQLKRI